MSEQADQAERQFDPSEHRLEEARKEGQVPKSKEIGTAATLVFGALLLALSGQGILERIVAASRDTFRLIEHGGEDMGRTMALLGDAGLGIGIALAPLMFGAVIIGAFATLLQTGFLISPELVLPKLERLNPMKQLGQMFSFGPALARTLTGVAKLGFVAAAVYGVARGELEAIDRVGAGNVEATVLHLVSACGRVLVAGSGMMLIIAAADYAYQRYTFMQRMKMTRDEVKQEAKQLDGSPEMKQKRKSMYREMSLNRIMKEVPRATVIIANPTHVSIALRYDVGVDAAPRVVAKGMDEVALTIRRIARENGVPIVENRALARALHAKVKVGRRISSDFYGAVAEVLSYVYRIKERARGAGRR